MKLLRCYIYFFIIYLLLFFVPLLVHGEVTEDDGSGSGYKFTESVESELRSKIGTFSVQEFVVTHYSPLDSAIKSDADSTKRLGPTTSSSSLYSPVQWYKEGDSWVFSAATEKRSNLVLTTFKAKIHNSSVYEKRTQNVDGHAEKPVFEYVFHKGISFSQAERESILPLSCKGRGMNYGGSPWSGSSGKIPKTGMIAADRAVLPQGTKLFVQGYGFGEVLDVGGDIKGMRLDLTVNDCAVALAKGKKPALVAFEKSKALIPGKVLDENLIQGLLKDGVYGSTYFNAESNDKTAEYETVKFDNPFNKGEVEINNIGVDDKQIFDSDTTGYTVNKYLGKVSGILYYIAQVLSMILIGYICILWLLAFLSYSNIMIANELLRKMSMGHLDILGGGFKKLSIWTAFSFLVVVIIMTGLLPKIFAFVYHLFSIFVDFISGFKHNY